jgi:hypothetical protein
MGLAKGSERPHFRVMRFDLPLMCTPPPLTAVNEKTVFAADAGAPALDALGFSTPRTVSFTIP